MPRTLTLLVGAGLVAGTILPVSADRGRRATFEPKQIASSRAMSSSAASSRGPQEAEGLVPPPSAVTAVGGPALFVVGNLTLSAGDTAVKNRLEGLGFSLTIKTASSVLADDAGGMALVFVSSSASASSVNSKFRDVEVPVVAAQSGIFDDMKMTNTTSGTHFGTTGSQTSVVISAAGHPLAAGFTGTKTVATSSTFAWGQVAASGIKAATLTGTGSNPNRATVFGYEPGAVMFGSLAAPARRVGFFLASSTLNATGWTLFDSAVTWASNKVAAPYFSPWGGEFTSPPSVEILCDTPGAQIYYTTDGSVPTTSSTPYTAGIVVSTTTQLTARAFFSDWVPSDAMGSTFYLSYGTVSDPVLVPNGGSGVGSITASVTSEPGSTVRYSTDGWDPHENSEVYSGTLTFAATTELKVRGFRLDYTPSGTVGATFHVRPAAPTIQLAPGTYPIGQTTTVTAADPADELHYSLNGNEPTQADPVVASGGTLPIGNFTLRVNAWRPNLSPSTSASATYTVTGHVNGGAIAATMGRSLALRPDGTLLQWGYYATNVPTLRNDVTNAVGIAVTGISLYVLKADGTVWTAQYDYALGEVSGLPAITAISSFGSHVLALDGTGHVWAWGDNGYGQLGDGTTTYRATPAQVAGLSGVVAIAAGGGHSLALLADGTLRAWGWNSSGQVGDGTTTTKWLPVTVLTPGGATFTGATAISAGSQNSAALRSDGATFLWGTTSQGVVGNGGSGISLNAPTQNGYVTSAAISVGGYHMVAAGPAGQPCVWGDNEHGQIGDGNAPNDRYYPTCLSAATGVPSAPTSVVKVAASSGGSWGSPAHTLALTADGRVFAWGANQGGQLGDGTNVNRAAPVQVTQWLVPTTAAPTLSPAPGAYSESVDVSLSAPAGAVIKYTLTGETPNANSPTYSGPLHLTTSTTVKAIATLPGSSPSEVTSGTYDVAAAAPQLAPPGGTFAANHVTVTVTHPDPTIVMTYRMGGPDPEWTDPRITSGETLTLAASGVLKVAAFKYEQAPGIRSETYALTGAPVDGRIVAGSGHSLARTPTGAMWGWGENYHGAVGDGSTTNRVLPTPILSLTGANALSVGADHSVSLQGAQVWAWGSNHSGQLGTGGPAAGSTIPVQVAGLADVTAVSARNLHTLALRADGTVWSWGHNLNGELGSGTTANRPTPGPVAGLAGVTAAAVSAGYDHSLALDTLGRVWSWGSNAEGQLGDGTQTQRLTPVQVSGLGGLAVTAVSAGRWFSLALTSEGRVWAWGGNSVGQLGINSTTRALVPTPVWNLRGVTSIAAGDGTGLALKPTGDVWTWGAGGFVGDGTFTTRTTPIRVPGLAGIVRIATGSHSFAVTYDGSVWGWGAGSDGAIGDGTTQHRSAPVRISGPAFSWSAGMPWFSPNSAPGTLTADLPVIVTSATPGASIHYTLTGLDPTEADATVSSGSTVTITQNATLKARAWMGSMSPSQVATATYTLKPPAPHTYMTNGVYTVGTPIAMTSQHPGTTMRYRTDGQTVTEADPVWPAGGLTVDGPMALRVVAFKSGWTASDAGGVNISARAQAPTLSPAGGAYQGTQAVVLSTTATEAKIHYRTDGLAPTELDPFVLSGESVQVERSQTVRARVLRPNWMPGDVAIETYIVDRGPAAAPQATPAGGTYAAAQTVSLSSSTAGATIRYTLDGSEPTAGSAVYSTALVVESPTIVKARTYALDFQPSAVTTAIYTIGTNVVGRPSFSLPSGTYALRQHVRVDTATAGALVRYTIDGTDPDESDPAFPTPGLDVDGELHLKARAFKLGAAPSPVASADYFVVGVVSAGGAHSAVLRTDGSLWLWGHGAWGALGVPSNSYELRPRRLYGPQSWTTVSAGSNHTLGVTADGRVWAWGYNSTGQLGDGTTVQKSVPTLLSLQDVVAVTAGFAPRDYGGFHSLALKADGTVWAWGSNSDGQLGNGTTDSSLVPIQVPALSGISRIVAAHGLSLALKTDGASSGTVYAWGFGAWSQLGDGTPFDNYEHKSLRPRAVLDDVVRMAAGAFHVEAVKSDGSVWTWGSLQGWSPNPSIRNAVPTAVAEASGVRSVGSGNGFTVALKADGTAVSWGWNSDLRLGTGSSASFVTIPAPVVGVAAAVEISSGLNHALALKRDGSVLAWGDNVWGQVGDGTQNDRATAFEIPFPTLPSDGDGDGLPTELESASGCNPYDPDSNDDGLLDGAAVAAGLSCSDPDMDDDGLSNPVERQRGLDPFRSDTDDDGSHDSVDCFPLDPARWQCPEPDPSDHTPPAITLTSPTNATLVSSVP